MLTKVRDYATKLGANVGWDGSNVLLNNRIFKPNKIENGVSYADENDIQNFLRPQSYQPTVMPTRQAPNTTALTGQAQTKAGLEIDPLKQALQRSQLTQLDALRTQSQNVAPQYQTAIRNAGTQRTDLLRQALQRMADNGTALNSGIRAGLEGNIDQEYLGKVTDLEGEQARTLAGISAQEQLVQSQGAQQETDLEGRRGQLVSSLLAELQNQEEGKSRQLYQDDLGAWETQTNLGLKQADQERSDFAQRIQDILDSKKLDETVRSNQAEESRKLQQTQADIQNKNYLAELKKDQLITDAQYKQAMAGTSALRAQIAAGSASSANARGWENIRISQEKLKLQQGQPNATRAKVVQELTKMYPGGLDADGNKRNNFSIMTKAGQERLIAERMALYQGGAQQPSSSNAYSNAELDKLLGVK